MKQKMASAAPHSAENMDTPVAGQQVAWAGIVWYLVLAFGISWAVWLGLQALGVPFVIRAAIGMFGPAVAALLVRGPLCHQGFADAGLRLARRGERGVFRYYLAAYLLVPALLAVGIGLALLIGYQHWALADSLHTLAQQITQQLAASGSHPPSGMTADQLATTTLVVQTVLAFTLAIPFNMIFTFGEEFGWRGYLLPRLAPLGGVPAAIIVGVIWGLWHAPVIVLNGYNFPGHPWLGVLMMVVFTTAYSFFFAWLRFRSGSVWPSTLAHATLNALAGFGLLLLSHGDSLVRPPLGLIGLVPLVALAIWLAVTGRLKPPVTANL